MSLNQNTLRIIANGDYIPSQDFVIEMAKQLLDQVIIVPRLGGAIREDGKPYWHDVYKQGVLRGNIYHTRLTNTFVVEIDGSVCYKWEGFNTIHQCEVFLQTELV